MYLTVNTSVLQNAVHAHIDTFFKLSVSQQKHIFEMTHAIKPQHNGQS